MAATTTLLGLVTPTQGTLSGTWGDTVNYGISDYVDIAVAGTLTLTNDGAVTLANTTGSSSGSSITSSLTGAGTVTAQFAIVNVTGTLTVAKVVTGPSYSKTYTVVNSATGGIVTFKASGQTGVSIAVGESAFVYFNGTDYVKVAGTAAVSSFSAGTTGLTPNTATTGAVTLAGTLAVANGGTGLTAGTSGGVLAYTATGTLASSTALAASALVIGGGAGAAPSTTTTGTGVVTALGVNTGTAGAFVVNGGALGTPSSGTLTNATGLPLTTGVTGTLATTNGGTGLTSFTSGGVVYASSTSALATGSALTFDGNKLAVSGSGIAGGDDRIFTVTNTAANSYGAMTLVGTSRGGYLNFYNGATAQAAIVGQASALTFYVGADSSGSQAMILNSTGLGIGTSSPASKLDVAGAIRTTYSATYYGTFNNATGAVQLYANGDSAPLLFGTTSVGGTTATERMRLDSAGNLGLGVTPSAWTTYKALQVGSFGSFADSTTGNVDLGNNRYNASGDKFIGTGYATLYRQVNDGSHKWFSSTASGTVDNIITFTQAMTLTAGGNLGLGATSPASMPGFSRTLQISNSSDSSLRLTGAGGSWEIGNNTTNNLQFYNGASSLAMTLDSSGNLGINTTSMGRKLNVAAPTAAGIQFQATGTSGRNYSIFATDSGASVTGALAFFDDTASAYRMILDSAGNLGLGVTPSAWSTSGGRPVFEMGSSAAAYINNNNVGSFNIGNNYYFNGSHSIYKVDGYASNYYQYQSAHVWQIAPSGTAGNPITFTQAMTLDASGNLGIGTTSGGGATGPRLYVENTNNTSGDSGIFSLLGGNCSNTSSYAFSALINGVGNKFYVYGNGNVVNTNNSYGAISDVKFKENIVDATPKLNDVLNLKVRNFNLKTEPNNKQIGFIAQEFEEVFPSMIDVSPDTDVTGKSLETTHKSIKLSVLVPILVKAIQEQQAIIESMRTEIDALKAKVGA